MAVVLGIIVAVSYGSGDFLGGRASRSAPIISVLAVVQLVGVVAAAVYAVSLGADVQLDDVRFGALGGAANVVALGCLYAGLATGRMGLVAPVTAVIASCIPVAWGLAHGESLSGLAWIGASLAVGAAAVMAYERRDPEPSGRWARAVLLAVTAGVMFGTSLVAYSEAGDDAGGWPLLSGRAASFACVVALALVVRRAIVLDAPVRRMAIGAGVLDVAATAVLLIAVREFDVALVAPIVALAPAFTVVWASITLHEPVGRLQVGALTAALAGLALLATG
jgi:drug/metabolite transporter (DMT)-like permease